MAAQAVGIPRLRLERIVSAHLPFVATTSCIQCGCELRIEFGAIGAVFKVGNSFVGIACDECLDPPSRAKAERAREAAEAYGN